jgi:hypothetical protein
MKEKREEERRGREERKENLEGCLAHITHMKFIVKLFYCYNIVTISNIS